MRIFVQSPHALIRESLVTMLGHRHKVTGAAEADVAIEDLCGYISPYPAPAELPTLALIAGHKQATAVEVLRLGYRGYLPAGDGEQRLEQALRAILRGEAWAERHVLAAALEKSDALSLTPRESEIHALVKNGLSNKQIASQLELSVNTVKVHVSRLLEKMGVKNRTGLMKRAFYEA